MYDPTSHAASPRASKYAAWAIVVMVLGGFLAITTGLCTGAVVIAGLSDNSGGEISGSGLVAAGLIFGGIPCLVGVAMFAAARKWGRRNPAPPPKPEIFE